MIIIVDYDVTNQQIEGIFPGAPGTFRVLFNIKQRVTTEMEHYIGVSIGNDTAGWFDMGWFVDTPPYPNVRKDASQDNLPVTEDGYIILNMKIYKDYMMRRQFITPNIKGDLILWVSIRKPDLTVLYEEKRPIRWDDPFFNSNLPEDVPGVPPALPIPVYSSVQIKNTGELSYAPIIGYSIRPIDTTQWKDAPLVTGTSFSPDSTQTINTGTVNVPAGVHGRVYAWIAIYDPDNNELARIGGPGDTSVYFDVP